MEILRTNQLSKSYRSIRALSDLNLVIKKGQVMGLLGPNGSGKTTTLGLILGILRPTSGDFTLFENQYNQARLKIGSILETPNFYPYLNAYENLEIVRRIKNLDKQPIDELLKKVNLYERRSSQFSSYSLGMKQRLAIAATLLGDPELLIFDEPTNGLDPQGISEVRTVLADIADDGKTVILASHILAEVEKICSHVAILNKGKLIHSGPVGNLLDNQNIIEVSAENLETLKNFLGSIPSIKTIRETNGLIECTVDPSFTSHKLNELAWKSGIILHHIVSRKRKLEEEFLQLTKNLS